MDKPKTNRQALELVISITETQTELARRLGLAKQYVHRWQEVPFHFALQTAEVAGIPVEYVVPELQNQLVEIIGPTDKLADLIRLMCRQPNKKKGRKPPRKRRRATVAK